MPTNAPGEHAPAAPIRPTRPAISASRGQVLITGAGLRPNCTVTVRITYFGDDIVDYLTYSSDAHGCTSVVLPESAISETVQLDVTDHRPDPAGDGGLLWSSTVIVSPTCSEDCASG